MTLSTTSFGRDPNKAGLLAVDIQRETGVVQVLGDEDVAHVLQPLDFGRDLAQQLRTLFHDRCR